MVKSPFISPWFNLLPQLCVTPADTGVPEQLGPRCSLQVSVTLLMAHQAPPRQNRQTREPFA